MQQNYANREKYRGLSTTSIFENEVFSYILQLSLLNILLYVFESPKRTVPEVTNSLRCHDSFQVSVFFT